MHPQRAVKPATTPRRRRALLVHLIPLPGDSDVVRLTTRQSGDSLAERLWPKVAGPWLSSPENPIGDDDCWVWLGAQTRGGRPWRRKWWYGRIRDDDGVMIGAHRAVLLVTQPDVVPLPGALACHYRCNNHLCCNPAHLRWGTLADNYLDQVMNGTRSYVPASVYSRSEVADMIAAAEVGY